MTVRVKICGITSIEQALMVQQAGADALGLVIYNKSPRYVDIKKAAEIRAAIKSPAMAVALLVNASENTVAQVIDEVRLTFCNFMAMKVQIFVTNLTILLFELCACDQVLI